MRTENSNKMVVVVGGRAQTHDPETGHPWAGRRREGAPTGSNVVVVAVVVEVEVVTVVVVKKAAVVVVKAVVAAVATAVMAMVVEMGEVETREAMAAAAAAAAGTAVGRGRRAFPSFTHRRTVSSCTSAKSSGTRSFFNTPPSHRNPSAFLNRHVKI